ncbi:MAG: insulinase family protein [Alphaproteobacteria bacterium]|nr:insulinase family protein [Alphaproteobacteria bacterium]
MLRHRLDNGLRVVLSPDGTVPAVGLAVMVDVGSRDETPGTSGFAHLFEHLMFQGSEHVAKGQHIALVQGCGGRVNANTSSDRTLYYQSLPAEQLPLGLWLEADRLRALDLSAENFENQRQTVMEERRQRVDDAPYGQAGVRRAELSFGCWAYAHPVIGYWEDLHAATLPMARAFHARWYRPGNVVLSIAGDLDPDETMARVEAWFGALEPGPVPPTPDLAQPERDGVVLERMTDPLARLPAVFVNHPAPPFDHPDFFTFEVIEAVLLGGPGSRAWRRLVVDEQLAVQVSGGYEARRGASLFTLQGVAGAGRPLGPIVDAWQGELDRLGREPVDADTWRRAVNRITSARVFSKESVLRRATTFARAELFLGDARWENGYLRRLHEVQPEALMAVARRWLRPEAQVVLEVHPPEDAS